MKTTKKIVAALLAVVLVVSLMSVGAFAATKDNVKQYGVYTALGDSMGSGFGQPQYTELGNGSMVDTNVLGQRIEGSYPDLIADWTGAKLNQMCYPGYTAAILRYELCDDYAEQANSWEINQIENFSFGVYTKEFLEENKQTFRDAIAESDLITLDIGLNDTWYIMMSLVYEIADQEWLLNNNGAERGTLAAELEKYGTWGTVARNVEYLLLSIAENPQLWAQFASELVSGLTQYWTVYQEHYRAIVEAIYDLNPDVTVVALQSCNSFKYLNLTPGTASNTYKFSISDSVTTVSLPILGEFTLPDSIHLAFDASMTNVTGLMYDVVYESVRKSFVGVKPNYYYADGMEDVELIGNHFAIPMYENSTIDNSGFNPHPTTKGHEQIAENIVAVLPEEGSSTGTTGTTSKFTDVSASAWYASFIDYAVDNGFMTGTSDTTFEPDGTLTRAMVVTMLYAMDGKPAVSGASTFSDVSSSAWYADPVAWAAANGVVSGFEDGTFRPNANVSREQLATMLRAYAGYKGKDTTANGDLSKYSDGEGVSPYAMDPVSWAIGHGVMSGNTDGTINPQGETTRAQAAAMFTSFDKNVLKK